MLAALLPRLPAVGLPLEEEGADRATRAERLLEAGSLELADRPAAPPLAPVLTAVGVVVGASPTTAFRVLTLLAAILVAPLVLVLALSFGLRLRLAAGAGLLVAVHPLLTLHAGGPDAGGGALATALLLGALWSLAKGRRRATVACLALLPLAEPLAVVYVPGLLYLVLKAEPSGRARAVVLGVVAVALLLTPWPAPSDGAADPAARLFLGALLGLPVLGLLALLPFVPRGLRRCLAGGRSVAVAWLVGALLHLFLLLIVPVASAPRPSWEGLGGLVMLAPLFVLSGLAGVRPARRRRVGGAALALALVASLFAVLGPLQTALFPEAPPAAGRLHRLSRSLAAARESAGPDGWIGLDLRPGSVLVERRLADLARGRPAGRLWGTDPAAEPGGEKLAPLPLAELPVGVAVGAVYRYRPEMLEVSTEGGRGIFIREPLRRVGPWVVVRIKRP